MKSTTQKPILAKIIGRAPQGARGLKSIASDNDNRLLRVAPRKGRVD